MPADGYHTATAVARFNPLLHLFEVNTIQILFMPQFQTAQLPTVECRIAAGDIAHIGAVQIPLPMHTVGEAVLMAKQQVFTAQSGEIVVERAGLCRRLGIDQGKRVGLHRCC